MDIDVRNDSFSGPHGEVPVRVYRPAEQEHPSAGLVWCHGGGFAFGDLDMPEADWVSRQLAQANVVVVSVDYRLAPIPPRLAEAQGIEPRDGVHFPVASEEVEAAFRWAVAAGLGTDANTWSIGGASAGANLAASAALRLRDEEGPLPRSVLLAYPMVHETLPPLSAELAAKVAQMPPEAVFTDESVAMLNANYVGPDADRSAENVAYGAPATAADLHGYPPTFIVNSEFDSLRASGEAFAGLLGAAGVDVLQVRENGTFHGHLNDPESDGAQRSIRRMIAWLTLPELAGAAHEK